MKKFDAEKMYTNVLKICMKKFDAEKMYTDRVFDLAIFRELYLLNND